jgi:hypothetical protein
MSQHTVNFEGRVCCAGEIPTVLSLLIIAVLYIFYIFSIASMYVKEYVADTPSVHKYCTQNLTCQNLRTCAHLFELKLFRHIEIIK